MRKLIYFFRPWCPNDTVGFVPGFWTVVGYLKEHMASPTVVAMVDESLLSDATIGVARGWWNSDAQKWDDWTELRGLGRWPNPGPETERARAWCAW